MSDQPAQRPTINGLLHTRDLTVFEFFSAWRNGGFVTFEEMLVSLCAKLVAEKLEMAAELVAMAAMQAKKD